MRNLPQIIIEVTRGPRVESRHAVSAVIVGSDGKVIRNYGDADTQVFPRSAIKALQALPLVESGAADAFGLEGGHIALACASHNGEHMHVEGSAQILAAAGLQPVCLECGAQPPALEADRDRLALQGKVPEPIHNNCSGKHAGFLCFAAHAGMKAQGYSRIGHPVQKEIAGVLESITGAPHNANNHGIDGCSIPTYAIPLDRLAAGFAKFSVADDQSRARSHAMQRIMSACVDHPEMVAGTGRFDTGLMKALKGRVFTKTGAEGVFVAALPELGIGVALKAQDGATRAAEVAVAALIESLLELDESDPKLLKGFTELVLKNWNGTEVGRVSAVLPR